MESAQRLNISADYYIERLINLYDRPRVRFALHAVYWLMALVLLEIRLATFYALDREADLYLFTLGFWLLLIGLFYGWRRLITLLSRSKQWWLLAPALLLTHYSLALMYWYMLEVGYLYFNHAASYKDFAKHVLGTGQWKVIHSGMVVLFNLTMVGVFLMPGFLLQLVRHLFTVYRQYMELEKEKLKVELDFLKNQINPHFFFNTLNNLFALSLQQSEKAPDMILKLSDMMRYSLYETNEERVPLEKEIRFIEDYIELEKLRHDDKVQVTFEIEGDPNGKEMAPLILATFIENAFKHGARSTMQGAWIDIRIQIRPDTLIFVVANNKPTRRTTSANPLREAAGGIGITNTRKRLNLLYPGQHQLAITDSTDRYHVQLTIQLT